MDYDDINGPTYCDFENLQNGIEMDEEGDEWFDRRVEEMEDCSPMLERRVEEMQPMLENKATEPALIMENEEFKNITNNDEPKDSGSDNNKEIDKNQISNMFMKAFAVGTTNKQKNRMKAKQPKILPSRTAALKATVSISAMYKHKTSSASSSNGCTLPTTPKFMKRYNKTRLTPKNTKSSEQLEMEKVEQLKWQANKLKELSKQSLKKSKKQPTPSKLTKKSTTEPVGFNFKTNERSKKSANEMGGASSSTSTFPMNLRSSNDDLRNSKPATPRTHVKPFRFLTEERLQQRKRHNSSEQRYVSRAEYVEKFQNSTPPRFRTKVPYDIANTANSKKEKDYKNEITVPKTPKLMSRFRSRPVTVLSKEEKEQQELEEMKKYQFKAKSFNPDIVRLGGEYGVRKPISQPLTNPVSPCFATKNRFSAKRDRGEMEKEEKKEFKAHPMPHLIFDKITGVPEKCLQDLTTPYSPALSFKRRKLRTMNNDESEETEAPPTKQEALPITAKPMPDFSNVFKPIVHHAHTEALPFSFERKYTKKAKMIDELVKKDDEEAAKKREFHANPLPDMDSPGPLPPKLQQPNTEIKPFKLDIEVRVKERLEKLQQKRLDEEEMERKCREFQATKAKDSTPFEPVKSSKPLTEFTNNFVLHTALRKEERFKYDEDRKKRELEREREEENRKALKEAEEEERVRKLRQSIVHKALPVQDFPAFNIKTSTKQLTKPCSPTLISKTRIRTQL